MMRIELDITYKSLAPFQSDELNKFCVITGKNGSGKTQLVQLFKTKQAQGQQLSTFKADPNPEKIYVGDFHTQKFMEVDYLVWKNNLLDKFVAYKNMGEGLLEIIGQLEKRDVDFDSITSSNVEDLLQANGITNQFLLQLFQAHPSNTVPRPLYEQQIKNFLVNQKQVISFLRYAANQRGVQVNELTEDDLVNTDFDTSIMSSGDIFNNKIELTFYFYQKRRKQNDLDYFHKERYKEQNDSISDEDFVQKYPSPIKLINQLLSDHGSKYFFEEKHLKEFNENNRNQVLLKNKYTGATISAEDLSSGESVIIDLILKLFQATYSDKYLSFPDLIVLDEPDAYLHPEMCKLLIDVLYGTFATKYGIQIILTTHSPSTVAMAPEDSIYELKNIPQTSLKQIRKDEALKVLLENIPTLSIDYKNHRQVFVESPTDSYYYQTIFSRIKTDKRQTFNLYFISTGYGKSNCDQVVNLTNELRKAGNNTAYGIIDWDLSNKPQANILVHGFEKKYSIENFIYNPIYLMILFISENCSNNITELGFNKSYNEYDLTKETTEKIQLCVEWFFKKIAENFPAYKYVDLEPNEFADGKTIMIPKWYNLMQGHQKLEPFLKKSFPSLNNAKYNNEGKLQEKLTNIAVKCYPFIPKETMDTLTVLSNP